MKLTKGESAEADPLIERLTRDDLEGGEFTDRYTEAVEALIEAKREHREPPAVEEPKAPGRVVDLMAALQESVAKAKASRGEDATVHEMPKKTAAKEDHETGAAQRRTGLRVGGGSIRSRCRENGQPGPDQSAEPARLSPLWSDWDSGEDRFPCTASHTH